MENRDYTARKFFPADSGEYREVTKYVNNEEDTHPISPIMNAAPHITRR